MRERILIELRENGRRVGVDAASRVGIVLRGERDAFPRRVNVGLRPRGAAMKSRVRRLSQLKGWPLYEWRFNIWADNGRLALTGSEPDALPDGLYTLQVGIEDLKTVGPKSIRLTIPRDGTVTATVNVRRDERRVELTHPLVDIDPALRRVLSSPESVLDQVPAAEWLTSNTPRSVRKACLLNVLAMTRATPRKRDHLLSHVRDVFFAATDRLYARVDPAFLHRLEELSDGPDKRFYQEGELRGGVHAELLRRIEDDRRVQPGTYRLLSFRAQGAPSLQAVVACPESGMDGAYHYADLDLDLGNPRQDVAGFLTHMGELLNPNRTDHFALRKRLAKGRARDFLYYRIVRDGA